MRCTAPRVLCSAALAVPALASPAAAAAAEIVGRDASNVRLSADDKGRAYVSFVEGKRPRHVFASGAINARQPTTTVRQVKFKIDYSGGRGEWKRFKNTCKPYDGPPLASFVAACKASDGSYWALQSWQRMLPNVGYLPWLPIQRARELRISHWRGPLAKLEVYQGWVYGGRFEEIFGRATYMGQAIHGYHTGRGGVPLDSYGRLIYVDTFNSQYGRGWRRENSFVAHNPSGMFCYGFYPYATYPGYPQRRKDKLIGTGERYRLTVSGPGVTPDVSWVGSGLGAYDPANAAHAARQSDAHAKVREMAAAYGDQQCGHH
jgi:hypothetical protein